MLSIKECLKVVAEDLRYLLDEWNNTIDDASLRRNSTVLRRLLVDGELQRAWKAAGFEREPRITSATLGQVLDRLSMAEIAFASAGGAHYGGVELRGALMLRREMSDEEIRNLIAGGVPSDSLGLRGFVEAPCIVVNGQSVNRRLLIKFIANRLGGAHSGSGHEKAQVEELYKLLDAARREVHLAGKPAVYFELLSIGQALAAADDIRLLREKAAAT